MVIAIIPFVVAVIGVLVFALASNTKVVEIGKCLMWCGILVTLLALASKVIQL